MRRKTVKKGMIWGSGLAIVLAALTPLGTSGQEIHRLSGSEVAIYNLAGHVEVVSGSGPDVVVRMTRGGSDAGRLSVETGEISGRETLRVIYPADQVVYPEMGSNSTTSLEVRSDGTFSDGSRGGDRVRVGGSGRGLEAWADLTVEVPAGRNIEVHQAVGRAEAQGTRGNLRIDTGSGEVSVRDVTGTLEVDTGSGRVEAHDIVGDVLVDTGSGGVNASGIDGDEVELGTGSGSITLAGVEAQRLRLDSGSGSIRLTGVRSEDVEVDTGSGSVEVELLTDVRSLVVDTGSGGVTIRVHEGFGAEVELDTGSGRIDVGLPMELRTVRRDYVRGRIGGGGGQVHVDTGSGSIRIVPGG